MRLEEYVGNKVRVKSNAKHPHAGENGEVIRVDEAKYAGIGLVIKEENFGEEFFVFNKDQLQILK